MLTDKQERFCKEYLVDLNATQAAIRAGYGAKTAEATASRLLRNVKVSQRLTALMAEKDKSVIASADEVMRKLTSVMRGECGNFQAVKDTETGEDGKAKSCIRIVSLPPNASDVNRAAELLGKRYGLFTEKVDMNATLSTDAQKEIDRLLRENAEPLP